MIRIVILATWLDFILIGRFALTRVRRVRQAISAYAS